MEGVWSTLLIQGHPYIRAGVFRFEQALHSVILLAIATELLRKGYLMNKAVDANDQVREDEGLTNSAGLFLRSFFWVLV